MKTLLINFRISPEDKAAFEAAAAVSGESLSKFFYNAALLRIQSGALRQRPEEPMKTFQKVLIEPYRAAAVSKSDARAIERDSKLNRAGKLATESWGRVKMPARKAK